MPGLAWATARRAFKEGGLGAFGTDEDEALKEIVVAFLRSELSLGGESYWDPVLYPQRTLDENAPQYVTMHSVA